jgi:hypothetical protein
MKQLKFLITTAMVLTASKALAGAPIMSANINKIKGAGSFSAPTQQAQFKLSPGVYALGNHESIEGKDLLIVEKYVNNDEQILAVLLHKEEIGKGERSSGQFFIGKPIKGGTSFMLSPMYINTDGNLVSEAEMSQHARAIEITTRTDKEERVRYPYLLQGMNGALNGEIKGMRRLDSSSTRLSALPRGNIFELHNDHQEILVSNNTVNINTIGQNQRQFVLNPVNGDGSLISFMSEGEYNTMGDFMTAESQVAKLAFFLDTSWDRDLFVVASPTMNPGEFSFVFYGKEHRSLWDILFPGLF